MNRASELCFDDDAYDAFMAEFTGDERTFVLNLLAGWPGVAIDWLIPGRAHVLGVRHVTSKTITIVRVIRFGSNLH
jgi:hypothetical protein